MVDNKKDKFIQNFIFEEMDDNFDAEDNLESMTEEENDIVSDLLEDVLNKAYLKEFRKYQPLTLEEEIQLYKDYRENGNYDSRDKLILHNVNFVINRVKKMNVYTSDTTELIQSGILGLIEAVEMFDPDKNVKIVTYAVHSIRKQTLKTVNFDKNKVYIPEYLINLIPAYRRLIADATKKGIDLTDEDIMLALDIKQQRLDCLKKTIAIEYTSFNMPVGNEEGEGKTFIGDIIPDENCEPMEAPVVAEENHEVLIKALQTLNPREYDVVVRLFGFNCKPMSSAELSEKYNVSKERICQIKKNALKKMKKVFIRNDIDSID